MSELLERYRRLALAAWIVAVILTIGGLTAAQGTLIAYALEKFTTHGRDGLVIKRGAAVRRDEYLLMLGVLAGASATLGACLAIFVGIALQHWPRIRQALLLLTLPVLTAGALLAFWYVQAPHLFAWGAGHILSMTAVQLVAIALVFLAGARLTAWLTRLLTPSWLREPHRP